MDQSEIVPSLIAFWRKRSNEDADRFRTRWRRRDLQRADPDIATRLHEQENLFAQACVTGTHQDIEIHGAALCRGWMAACKVCEEQRMEDRMEDTRKEDKWAEKERGEYRWARWARNEPWER